MVSAEAIKQQAKSFLEATGIKSMDLSDETHAVLSTAWRLDTMKLGVLVVFDSDGESLQVSSVLPMRVPKGKLLEALDAVNTINKTYRWTRFYVDPEDGRVMSQVDAVVNPDTVGPVVRELIIRTTNIADDAYPILIKELY